MVGNFVRDRCEVGPKGDTRFRVGAQAFRTVLNEGTENPVDGSTIKKAMQAGGFESKYGKIDGVSMRCYFGLRWKVL